MAAKGLVATRSQAESFIRMGKVHVDGVIQKKPGFMVGESADLQIKSEQYVSRAGLKLASVTERLKVDFRGKNVLDVGSSTGGFTDYALRHGAAKVIAVDVGTNQLHPTLHGNPQIELHEQTDIRAFLTIERIDIVVMDVSFVSSRDLLPHIVTLCNKYTELVIMVKPQFEAGKNQTNKGIIKNDKERRTILADFETWSKKLFVIKDKSDSDVAGSKGNLERFYLMKIL